MSKRQLLFLLLIVIVFLTASGVPNSSLNSGWSRDSDTALIVGRNINMVSGTKLPGGDPWLQRQNEPSIAVSTRNSLHLLAGANDYRTIDMPDLEKKIPGQEEKTATPPRDAWLGVFKSFDGGQSWISTLLPGFPQDTSYEGFYSPLQQAGYYTAADPVVRAGTNGLFYYSGIAFERDTKKGVVFVSRFIDNNNKENGDPIKYIDTVIIYSSKSGEFIDKPWIAVDIPRDAAHTVPIIVPDTPVQYIPASDVYIAYSVFSGEGVNRKSKILFAKSIDCGAKWGASIELSTGQNLNQGATIAVDPRQNGQLYVAWRRFTNGSQADAIIVASSNNGGKKFNKVTEVASIAKFDQGTTVATFRTNSYPSVVVDNKGIVYLAWSQRGVGPGGDARIVISTSNNGIQWSYPKPIDNHSDRGHQFMPSLTYAGSKIIAAWYDERDDFSKHFDYYINDVSNQPRHTTDIRVAQADASKNPFFGESTRVSRYLHAITKDGIKQIRFNPPNYPLFELGTKPFHGDYIDISPSPMFLPEHKWRWTCNTSSSQSLVFHVAWTDNRDVKPPADGDWKNYTPPDSNSIQDPEFQTNITCSGGQTGMRNQNIYTSRITQGLEVGSPGNSKPLGKIQRAFVVFVKNTTDSTRRFKLTIDAPWGVKASFLQFKIVDKLIVGIAPYSSISRTVFVKSSDPNATVRVDVSEVGGALRSFVLLNPDDTNPEIINPDMEPSNPNIENLEVHNPNIENPDIVNPNIENPDIVNPNIENPDIVNPDIVNPNIENPDIVNPDIENPDIVNPNIENPNIENPDIENGSLTDNTWIVTNNGNTTSAYTFKMLAANFNPNNYPSFGFQLLIYRVHKTPIAIGCELKQEHHDELIANIVNPYINPNIENPNIENPDIENSSITNATFCAEPKDEVWVSLRVYDPNKNDNVKFDPRTVTGAVTAQAVNTKDAQEGSTAPPVAMSPVKILTESLPDGVTGQSYSTTLTATGGSGKYTWSLANESAPLPPGLGLSNNGVISGTPLFEEDHSYPLTHVFIVQVTDKSNPLQTAIQELSITITAPGFTASKNMIVARAHHRAIKLQDGRVLIAGGQSNRSYHKSAEIFDPSSGSFLSAGEMNSAHSEYTMTLLSSGKVLIVGGYAGSNIAEIFDPNNSTIPFSETTGDLNYPRINHTATLLADGTVLIAGGLDSGRTAEIYDPGNDDFTEIIDQSLESIEQVMVEARFDHTATLLPDGRVLIVGGRDPGNAPLASAEIYDPAIKHFDVTGSMSVARHQHTATLLLNGKVLITGGTNYDGEGGGPHNTAEIYNPATGLFESVITMTTARASHTATLLNDGTVLLTGGDYQGTGEIFNPSTSIFESAGSMVTRREEHTATFLLNGRVLITGGNPGNELNSTEIFQRH